MSLAEDRFLNRELSSIDFFERVLTLAEDQATPLLERVKFLAIFANNLDEFYMVRVAGIKSQRFAGIAARSADGMTPAEQLSAITEKVEPLAERHARLFTEDVMPALREAGIEIVRWNDLDEGQRKELERIFTDQMFPVITPLAVDPAHPFPYISNLSLNLAVTVQDEVTGWTRFARVKVPPVFSRFVSPTEGELLVPLEDVIAANLDQLFPGMKILEHHTFRVTRNADLEMAGDDEADLLQALEEELGRKRGRAVRLEVEPSMTDDILDLLLRELDLGEGDVHMLPGPLGLVTLWDLYSLDRPDLKDRPFQPLPHPALVPPDDSAPDIFSVLRHQDVIVHHPYDSFTTSAQRLIEQAADDPDVLAIKQTLYRTGEKSPIVDSLIEAARAGKQVVVLVELKARFDEAANIRWARTLEQAGCHVVYGLVGLKTHCKLSLVVRREADGLRTYVHVGTGNYNPDTARIYEDLGLLTSGREVTADVSGLFNYLTGYSRQTRYRSLVVAPFGLRERLVSLIERHASVAKAGGEARIIIKVNALTDEQVIDALYSASQAGVKVDLIVRGPCALRPGVEGLSEGITVRSILGRFLEHSRIFYFASKDREDVYIGSADLMHRNLDRRVEVLVRVPSPLIKKEVKALLDLALADNISAWNLNAQGSWDRVTPSEGEPRLMLQEELMRQANLDA